MITTSPLNYVWHGPDVGVISDRALVSPPLQVGPGAFSFTFSHRYSFEYSGTSYYDGGVIEISTDNGTTWADVGTTAAGYPSRTLFSGSGNVLGGRRLLEPTA